MARTDRRRREAAGRRAETLCVWFLRLKGYRILARRFRHPTGEIDIIARRGNTVAFIEVKTRQTAAAGLEALTSRQRRRIARAASAFLQRRADLEKCTCRFDLVVMTPWKMPQHHLDAWRESWGESVWAR